MRRDTFPLIETTRKGIQLLEAQEPSYLAKIQVGIRQQSMSDALPHRVKPFLIVGSILSKSPLQRSRTDGEFRRKRFNAWPLSTHSAKKRRVDLSIERFVL